VWDPEKANDVQKILLRAGRWYGRFFAFVNEKYPMDSARAGHSDIQ
jgi:hypothetical protein